MDCSMKKPAAARTVSMLSGLDPMALQEKTTSSSAHDHRRQPRLPVAGPKRLIAWAQSQIIGRDEMIDTPFGRYSLTYADHTASGRSLDYVEKYINQEILPRYGNTHTEDSYVGRCTTEKVHEAIGYIKSQMGGSADDVLIFCGSGATAAIKHLQEVLGVTVAQTLRERALRWLEPHERWVVFVGPYEHHSNLLSWRQSLAEVVEIGLDDAGLLDLAELEAQLSAPEYAGRPKLGSFSACSNVTGILTDTRAVARLLHSHGAFACFDFAASASYVDVDMRSGDMEGYDAVFVGVHKMLGGPGGPGILLMNRQMYRLHFLPPSTCGGGTVNYVNGFSEAETLYVADIEAREQSGTPPILGIVRAALAFWVKEYIGIDVIVERERLHSEMALPRLLSNPKISVLGNTAVERLPIVSFLVFPAGTSGKPLHGRFVTKLLNDLFGVQARGGCACAGPYGHALLDVGRELSLQLRSAIEKGYTGLKPGWTRVSFAYYLSSAEFHFILSAIEFIADYGHRFLPLYQFDWATGDWTFRKSAAASWSQYLMEVEDVELLDEGSRKREQVLGKYLDTARRIVLSLPESRRPTNTIPPEIDPSLVLFMI